MATVNFIFPEGCILECNREVFLAVAAESNILPFEQCAHKEKCSVLPECMAAGQECEQEFRSYKRPIKETSRLAAFQ